MFALAVALCGVIDELTVISKTGGAVFSAVKPPAKLWSPPKTVIVAVRVARFHVPLYGTVASVAPGAITHVPSDRRV